MGPYLKEKVDTFIDKEFDKHTSAQEAARFLFRVLCNEFVDDFVYVAAKTMITMEDFVASGSEHDQTKLRDAYQEYVAKCSEAACGAIDRSSVWPSVQKQLVAPSCSGSVEFALGIMFSIIDSRVSFNKSFHFVCFYLSYP